MQRLEGVTTRELREYLDRVEGKTATLRLVVGINYKNDIPQSELAEWYGVTRTTIHNWLDRLERLEDEPLEDVIYDEERPGRPPKLDPAERELLESILQEPPQKWEIDARIWTPSLVQTLLAELFDVAYTRRHVRTMMNRVGVDWERDVPSDEEHPSRAAAVRTGAFPEVAELDEE